jgi:hypothetical protein
MGRDGSFSLRNNEGRWLWIPGSRFASPGMTTSVEPNLAMLRLTPGCCGLSGLAGAEILTMKIALLALLGLILGALGGAALGIGAGLAWVEIFKTTDFEGYSGMLVFFTFMPLGAMIGGLGGALVFGLLAFRDSEIAIEREQPRAHDN